MTISEVWSYVGIIVVGIAAISFLLRTLKTDNYAILEKAIDQYKEALAIRDTTIADLQKQLSAMQAQLASQQKQIDMLNQEKKILQDNVTGTPQLEKIITNLELFNALLLPDGILAKYSKDHKEMKEDLGDIKRHLQIDHRTKDLSVKK